MDLDEKLTILVGPNAVGKTNVIEALQLVTSAESFRNPQWGELVRWGAPRAEVTLNAEGDGRVLETRLQIEAPGKRTFLVNGKRKRSASEVVGRFPSVVFTPDDLRLVKDSAEKRRGALDSLGAQISPAYAQLKKDYDRILKQRNQLLREERLKGHEGEIWTQSLVSVGSSFFDARRRLFSRLSNHLSESHKELASGKEVETSYVASWDKGSLTESTEPTEQAFRQALERREVEEQARKTTLVGPHRDDLMFLLDGKDARSFGSQGQQRTIALSWKLAEVIVIAEVSQQRPLLLLDDVMSELDEKRRQALTIFAGNAAQTVVTSANRGYLTEDLLNRAKVVTLGEKR